MSARDAVTAREASKRPKPVIGRTATKSPPKPKVVEPEPAIVEVVKPEPETSEAEPEAEESLA